jgi:hypothetical protein
LSSGTAYTFQVNAANSAGTSPYSAASNSVTPASPSSYESIASATPSGTGTVTFSSIPGTYKSLQIRCNIVYSSTSLVRFQYNSDTGSNYARHILYGDGSVAGADASASYTSNAIIYVGGSTGTNVGIVDIHDYASTTKYKTSRTFSGNDNNGSGYITLMSGLWMSTSAVTSIDILCSSNFLSGTTFALYGIKG